MVIRECAKFSFIPETDYVEETQMYEILANNRNLGMKLSLAQILIVTTIVCVCACVCVHARARMKCNGEEMIFGDSVLGRGTFVELS